MTIERMTALITVLTIVIQSGLYLVSGGFTIGNRVTEITSEIKLLRSEVVSQNEIQNYRIEKL
ncbi:MULTISPECIES: hypothetical protein, partial [unclassified Nodularia (in: cyanobacteria)]|uniref:hypothetical protein n=1 Tax=unclassified Nodularia (in: cyanobacteria) TaxID=2656917 RepID=UPI001D0F5E41